MRHPRSFVFAAALALCACGGPAYVRDTDVHDLDRQALSTRLDRTDLDRLLSENAKSLKASALWSSWLASKPTVAIFPIANETSEHVDSQMTALLSKLETLLVNEGGIRVISQERQTKLIHQIDTQHGESYDPASAPAHGKQVGADFYVTGKLTDDTERTGDERRVQYYLFMQVLEVSTGTLRWQNEAKLSKGLIR